MERKEFFKSAMALCSMALLPAGIIESCKKQSYAGPANVNFTLDLSLAAYSALNTVSGSVIANGILIIRRGVNDFEALSATCTHQGCQVGYNYAVDIVQCPCHGGQYNTSTGAVISGPPPSALTKYKTAISGNILTITS